MDNFTIKVETSKLTAAADEFEQTGKDVSRLVQEMCSKADELTGPVWQGSAQTTYVNKFRKFSDQAVHLEDTISSHATALREIATTYDSAEETAIGAAQALADNNF